MAVENEANLAGGAGSGLATASAVAVAETPSSNSARAVPVATAAVSISGGIAPGTRLAVDEGVGLGGCVTPGGRVDEAVGEATAVAIDVRLAVAVAAPGRLVAFGVYVLEGVRLGPVGEAVRVGVREGVHVAVRVDVRVGVRVGVLEAVGDWTTTDVLDAVDDAVAVASEVGLAGGALTVKVPSPRLRGTAPPDGEVAAALLRSRFEVPGAADASTLNVTLATAPSGIASWFRPKIMTLTVPAEG
jgi:hypothetical protein